MSNHYTEVELARAAVADIAPESEIGALLPTLTSESGVTVRFESAHPGYVGWHWSVAISGSPLGVDEVWMEPGDAALVAKPWLPWSERVQPGDLAPGDVLPTDADDARLMPGYAATGDDEELAAPLSPQAWSIGLGRERVLSVEGIDEAVYRWRDGESGPRTQHARYADLPCSSCGWLMTIGGRLGQAFGVCANAMSPSDGRIVAMDHGCGAHSEGKLATGVLPVTELAIDELGYEAIDRADLPEVVTEPEVIAVEVDSVSEDSDSEDSDNEDSVSEASTGDEPAGEDAPDQSGPAENLQ